MLHHTLELPDRYATEATGRHQWPVNKAITGEESDRVSTTTQPVQDIHVSTQGSKTETNPAKPRGPLYCMCKRVVLGSLWRHNIFQKPKPNKQKTLVCVFCGLFYVLAFATTIYYRTCHDNYNHNDDQRVDLGKTTTIAVPWQVVAGVLSIIVILRQEEEEDNHHHSSATHHNQNNNNQWTVEVRSTPF